MAATAESMLAWTRSLLGVDGFPEISLEQYLQDIPTLDSLGDLPSGTTVLVRGDVDSKPGAAVGQGDIRLRSMKETLDFGRAHGWKQVIFGHIGRDQTASLEKVAKRLGEILGCEQAILDVTGQRPRCFRPAGGFLTDEGVQTVQNLGYTSCNATVNPGDWWQRDPDMLIRSSYRGRSREGVTLMHSGALGIVRALPGYINALKAKGFEFVTLSELAHEVGRPLPELPKRTHIPEPSGEGPNPGLGSPIPEADDEYAP